jgi:hypothetical protein
MIGIQCIQTFRELDLKERQRFFFLIDDEIEARQVTLSLRSNI